ncbi:thioesterase family protein [Vibrio galatheae]|nr:thioesterase family protein [Vibrio galatheae]
MIALQSANGYAHLEADIWDSNGALIAISRQSVAVFS